MQLWLLFDPHSNRPFSVDLLLTFDPQDNVFRLGPHFENGRGKSPYDPKMLSVSLLLGKSDE